MVPSVVAKLIYSPPRSVVVTAMTVLGLVSTGTAGYMEMKGKHVSYSKMWSNQEGKTKIASKKGMLVAYAPAFLAGFTSLFVFPFQGDFRFALVRLSVLVHFFKRLFEVLFIHKFSGWMDVESAVTISLSYFVAATTLIYAQHLTRGLQEPEFDLKYAGILIFLVGICGNFYHHYLLSKLRSKGDKQYKIPKGGLFDKVICPHYLFEIIGFLGISCISQTLYSWSWALGITIYLTGRSYATRKWYESKFEEFPKDVKALVPYVF